MKFPNYIPPPPPPEGLTEEEMQQYMKDTFADIEKQAKDAVDAANRATWYPVIAVIIGVIASIILTVDILKYGK